MKWRVLRKAPTTALESFNIQSKFLEKENYIQIEESEYCFDNSKIKNPSI